MKLSSLARALAVTALAVGLTAVPGFAQDEDDDFAEEDVNERECICADGMGACQHKLRNPKEPSGDPCWCHRCREYSKHDGGSVPFGWNPLCYASSREGAYLNRHSAAWGITCSDCVQDKKSCKFDPANCPNCGDAEHGDPAQSDEAKKVLHRLERERRHFKKPKKVIVLWNRHFYVVSDMGPIKVRTRGGSHRLMSGHEWAHLMIERAEYARREFEDHFGGGLKITAPTGMYFPKRSSDAKRIQASYFGNPNANLLYGGGNDSGVGDGMCFHGFCASGQDWQDDHGLHFAMRHMLGHEFISCWLLVSTANRTLPRWLYHGAGHWLGRLQKRFREDGTFCNNEGKQLSGTGRNWSVDISKMANSKKLDPIEKLFGVTSSNQMTLEYHKRAWSYLDLCLAEWREPFARVLADIRRQREIRDAFMEHLSVTPEIFDERWRRRVLGKRESLGPRKDEGTPKENDSPSVRERRGIRNEEDLATLAARIRGLGTVDATRTIKLLIDLLAKDSELVRSQILVTLVKTKDIDSLDTIWQYGLAHEKAIARAYTARACGQLELSEAIPMLRDQLNDRSWFARAEAALALGKLHDAGAMSALRRMVNDRSEKARVAAMDALASFGEDGFRAVDVVLPHLNAGPWQLRIVAAQTLGELGRMEAVEPLITRMEAESGRVRDDIYEALKKITRDDLGRKPEHWRDWWDDLKRNTPGDQLPGRPPPTTKDQESDKPDPNARYAKQKYYGIEIYSNRVGFVLDVSASMLTRFEPDPKQVTALSRTYTGSDKITICKEEIAWTLKGLDPRSYFNVIAFGTRIRTWKKHPKPASSGNVKAGIGFLRGLAAAGETNYYGALRAVLDLDEGPDSSPNFRNTPDTLTFLTDGVPTRGEITDADTLLEWYTSLNRYARIKTHVIAFGSKGVDVVLLRAMAEQNGGRFVHVAERRAPR